MKSVHTACFVFLGLLIGLGGRPLCWSAQQPSAGSVPVSTVVSVEAKHGKDIPAVNREDVRVFQGHDRLQLTDWTPLKGNPSGLELFVLIDEASGIRLSNPHGLKSNVYLECTLPERGASSYHS